MQCFQAFLLYLFPALALGADPGTRPAPEIDFNRDIRPILSDRCFNCHGPDASNQKSEFRLDTEEHAHADLGGTTGITPGDLERSTVHHRIRSSDADDMMPPPDSNLQLSDEERDLLDRWILSGARYEPHWAFKPIPRSLAPPDDPTNWSRNVLDRYILARMRDAGLAPAPEATGEKWLRRVTFDLTGLPPTLQELHGFKTALGGPGGTEQAYEAVVERLLASDAYAERLTSEWLDVARYSDTYGYQVDRERFVWPWRDWVIRAFRENLPYDQFVTWQLAGDLLPNPTRDQILATTFNRLHPQKVEGGSVPEEFRIEYVADRTHTFGTAFLGLTLECARCHDHKYDPVTSREYYQLTSFFANIDEAGLYSYFTKAVPTPTLPLTTPAQDESLAKAEEAIAAAQATVADVQASARDAFAAWLVARPTEPSWPGLQAHVSFDDRSGNKLPDRVRPDKPATTSGNNRSVAGIRGTALKLTGDDVVKLPDAGRFGRDQPFSIALWIHSPEVLERAVIFRRSKAWTDAGSRGYELLLEDGKLSAALIHFWPGNAIRVRAREALPAGEWHHVTVKYDGSSTAAGLRIFLDGRPLETETVRDALTRTIDGGGEPDLALGERFRDTGFTKGLVDELHVFNRELTPLEIAHLHDGSTLSKLLATPAEALTAKQREQLFAFFLATAHPPYAAALDRLRAARTARSKIMAGIKEIMVMRETEAPRPAYLLTRGMYADRGEEVHAATPAVLPPFPAGQARNRLGLARWLTSPDHPLTARVTVNRYWQMFFGNGLVGTPEDFGSQGKPPTHPDLLDWLARDFIAHDWNLHHLFRTIVLSSTYRQGPLAPSKSGAPLLAREIDPENLLLSHGTDDRLAAEMIRDNALALSGLLVRRVGGAPAKPYEVSVSFKPTKPDQGDGLYRRSVYTWWKRTAPAPVMTTLDASKRDICRVHREVTASPLQALVLLNGPQFVEASRVLAGQLLAKHPDAAEALIAEAFQLFTSRPPTPEERAVLQSLYDEQRDDFARHPERAHALLKTGKASNPAGLATDAHAAATILVNSIMNLDEAVTKR